MVRKIPRRAYEEVTFLEAQVVSYRMDDRDGGMWKLTFYVDDTEDAQWLFNCYPRTTVAMGIKALDYDNPDQSDVVTEGERTLKRAAMLCRNMKFQKWLESVTGEDGTYRWGVGQDEQECVKALHWTLGIKSRSELKTNHSKIVMFNQLVDEFQSWMKSQ